MYARSSIIQINGQYIIYDFFFQEIIVELLKCAMMKHTQSPGFLIDGFPRELGQAKQFEDEVALTGISTH